MNRHFVCSAYLPLVAGLFLTALGCGKATKVPQLDASAFPKAVARIETTTNEVLAAFAEGRPKDADAPLHTIDKVLNSASTLAGVAGLSDEQKTSLTGALQSLIDGFGELHEPMHEKEFPADFDFSPIKERLEGALANMRSSLPAPLAAEVAKIVEKSSAAAAVAAPAAEESADHDHADHDHADHEEGDGHDHDGHDHADHDHDEDK